MKNSLIIFLVLLIATSSFTECYKKVNNKNLRATTPDCGEGSNPPKDCRKADCPTGFSGAACDIADVVTRKAAPKCGPGSNPPKDCKK